MQLLDDQRIFRALRWAFQPYLCVPLIDRTRNAITVRIYRRGSELLGEFDGVALERMRVPHELRAWVQRVRAELGARNIELHELPADLTGG